MGLSENRYPIIMVYHQFHLSCIDGNMMQFAASRQQSLWVKVENLQNPQIIRVKYKDKIMCKRVHKNSLRALGVPWFNE
jgi:hypothetical protein